MRIRWLIGFGAQSSWLLLLLLPTLGAQTAPPRQSGIVLRSKTRLVQLSVVVRDKQGQPVTDLRESDFTVEDEGKRQEIRFFDVESQPAAAKVVAPGRPDVFSNRRSAHSGSTGGITVILLDGLNTRWGDQEFARKNVVEYLSQIQPRDRVALYTLGKDVKILHDFTEEPAELVKALAAYRGQYTPDLQASSLGVQTSRLGGAIGGIAALLQEEANYFKRTRALMTFAALEAIAHYLTGVPGRKNLLWVSGGFPLAIGDFADDDKYESLGGDPKYSAQIGHSGRLIGPPSSRNTKVTVTFEKELENVSRALNAADVAVYPVDARGLTTNPRAMVNIVTLKELAGDTGGRAYYNRNDLMNSIREAVQDSVVSYTLAYYPSEQKSDGRFRKVRVKVNRPGFSVRHRSGYYDAINSPFDEKAREAVIRGAVWSPLDATAIALDAQLETRDAANPDALTLRVKVDTGNLMLEQRDGRWVGQFDLALVQTDEKGSEHEVRLQTVPLEIAPDLYEVAVKQGMNLSKAVQRNQAATALRVVVLDAASGSVGRVIIPFQKR